MSRCPRNVHCPHPPRPRRRDNRRRHIPERRGDTPCRTVSRSDSRVLPSLWHAAPSVAAGYYLELLGSPISNSLAMSCADPEPGPLPSTGITQLQRYYQPLRHPIASGLSLAGVRLGFTLTHAMGFPVLRGLPLPCMPSPLPPRNLWVLSSLASPAVAAFPVT